MDGCFYLFRLSLAPPKLMQCSLLKKFSHIFQTSENGQTTKSTIARQVRANNRYGSSNVWPRYVKILLAKFFFIIIILFFFFFFSTGANYFDKWPKNCRALFKEFCMHSRSSKHNKNNNNSNSKSKCNNNNIFCWFGWDDLFFFFSFCVEWQRLLSQTRILEWHKRQNVSAIE